MMVLPELILCINASFHQNSEMMLGIVIGSMFFHLLVIGGISSMVRPIRLKQDIITKQLPALIFGEIVLVYLAADYLLHGTHAVRMLSRTDGMILLLLFFGLLAIERKNKQEKRQERDQKKTDNRTQPTEKFGGQISKQSGKQVALVLIEMIVCIVLSEFLLREERNICQKFSIEQNIFTIVIISMVICLPKLVVVMIESKTEKTEIIFGDIINANKTDSLLILGLGTIFCPAPVSMSTTYHLIMLCIFSIVVWGLGLYKRELNRVHGCIMMTIYVSYMVFVCINALS
jgi:cation:H+ antiporter